MARKRKKTKKRSAASREAWSLSLSETTQRRLRLVMGWWVLLVIVVVGGAYGVGRLERHVMGRLRVQDATIAFVDLPEIVEALAFADLHSLAAEVAAADWTERRVCRAMAESLETSGWIRAVHHVRRMGDARFEISCDYRIPLAMVQQGSTFMLVDEAGVRLPGVYPHDPGWHLIQGVEKLAPAPGAKWLGQDIQAGLAIIESLVVEPFGHQVTAVLVDNYDGRLAPGASHIVLSTGSTGRFIRWGSAPGDEVEENFVEEKLAILRENFRATGRIDANHTVIDVSVFPDRMKVPG